MNTQNIGRRGERRPEIRSPQKRLQDFWTHRTIRPELEQLWRELASGQALKLERRYPGHIRGRFEMFPGYARTWDQLQARISQARFECLNQPGETFAMADKSPPSRLSPEEIAAAEKLAKQLRLLRKSKPGEIEQIVANRSITLAALAKAEKLGVLRFGEVCGYPSWVLSDYSERCAEARRLDNQVFPAIADENGAERLGTRKAHTLAGSKKNWLVGLRVDRGVEYEILDAAEIILPVEGGPDYLALWDFVLERELEWIALPVAILGRGVTTIHEQALKLCQGKRIRIFAHADKDGGGLEEARKWGRQFQDAGCSAVEIAHLEYLHKSDGSPIKDVNDLVALDPTQRGELEQLFSLDPHPRLEMLQTTTAGGRPTGAKDFSRLFEEVKTDSSRYDKESAQDEPKTYIEILSPSEIKAYVPPPGTMLIGVNHVVRGSVTVVGGPPGVGKSRALIALAEAGATGYEWLGQKVHVKFKTLIVQNENGRYRLKLEFSDLDEKILDPYLRITPPPPFGLCFGKREFREQLKVHLEVFKPDLVGIDPWNSVARDDKAKDYLESFDLIRDVIPPGEDGPALAIAAHTRKPTAGERANGRALLNLLAGSYVLTSVPRCVFILQHASDAVDENRVVVTCCKNNDGELGIRSVWNRENGLWTLCPEFDWDEWDNPTPPAKRDKPITEEQMAAVFKNGSLSRKEAVDKLIALTGKKKQTCYNATGSDSPFDELHYDKKTKLLSWMA
jgi:hypothetical protein